MKTFSYMLCLALTLSFMGCRRTDVRDFTIAIPKMTAKSHDVIAASLAAYSGVEQDSLRFNYSAHTLSLRYDSMQIAKKNIEMAIAAAGYEANGVTPESVGAKQIAK